MYGLIILSVLIFGGCFALQDVYRKKRGSGLRVSMESACIGSTAGLIVLLIINGLSLDATWFTLLTAFLTAFNAITFTFCAFKALNSINLSLFSLFSMLGGMALPFFQGIFFYNEGFTIAKGVCVAFICIALALTVEKGDKKKGRIYYLGIFTLNGMSGVISKWFTSAPFPKNSAECFSVWGALFTVLLSGVIWAILALLEKRNSAKTVAPATEFEQIENKNVTIKPLKGKALWTVYAIGALQGTLSKVANFLLVLALTQVQASVQYPMVTGGTMIVSTILCFFGDKKPNKKEILSIALAFIGMLALFFIPV